MTWWKSFETSLVIHTALALTSSHFIFQNNFDIMTYAEVDARVRWLEETFYKAWPIFCGVVRFLWCQCRRRQHPSVRRDVSRCLKRLGKCRYLSMPPISWVVRACRSSGTAPNSAASESRKKSATFARARASRRDACFHRNGSRCTDWGHWWRYACDFAEANSPVTK